MTKTLEEAKNAYIECMKEIVHDDFDNVTAVTDAFINKSDTAKEQYEDLSKDLFNRLKAKGLTEEDIKLLMNNYNEWLPDVMGILLEAIQKHFDSKGE